MMQLTIDVKDSALEKVMYLLEHLKNDVKIISKNPGRETDIELVRESDPDYAHIEKRREERKKHPENYLSEDAIEWD